MALNSFLGKIRKKRFVIKGGQKEPPFFIAFHKIVTSLTTEITSEAKLLIVNKALQNFLNLALFK